LGEFTIVIDNILLKYDGSVFIETIQNCSGEDISGSYLVEYSAEDFRETLISLQECNDKNNITYN